MNTRHLDCRNYAPVDVAKGMCHANKQMVVADDQSCENFERLPKCQHCARYVPDTREYLGTCTAAEKSCMTYPALSGVACEWFAFRDPN